MSSKLRYSLSVIIRSDPVKRRQEEKCLFMTSDDLQAKLDSKHQKVHMEVEFSDQKKLQGHCCL